VVTPWGSSNGVDFEVTGSAFYFAEGTCRPEFAPYLTIQNPQDSQADVSITYMRGDGQTQGQDIEVPAHSRYTVTVKDVLGEGNDAAYDFSARVESTNNVDIVAERPQYFDYKWEWTGGTDVVGALSAASSFYFAEGTCRPGFAPYLTIQNPELAEAQVKITYMRGDGSTNEEVVGVPPHSRYTVTVKDVLGEGDDAAYDFSARVECINNKEIIVERPQYFDYKGEWTGGSDVVGFSP
jgi:hypothetical protein